MLSAVAHLSQSRHITQVSVVCMTMDWSDVRLSEWMEVWTEENDKVSYDLPTLSHALVSCEGRGAGNGACLAGGVAHLPTI